jgi:hypothetical protein
MVETRPALVLNNLSTAIDARPPAHLSSAPTGSLRAIIGKVFGRTAA